MAARIGFERRTGLGEATGEAAVAERLNDQIFVIAPPKFVPPLVRLTGKKEGKVQEVMILGGNAIGARIAAQLGAEKTKRVKLIESRRAMAETLAGELKDVLVIHGEGTDIDLMATEGLGEMDAFVAVTDDEESNLVTCLLAKHLGVKPGEGPAFKGMPCDSFGENTC